MTSTLISAGSKLKVRGMFAVFLCVSVEKAVAFKFNRRRIVKANAEPSKKPECGLDEGVGWTRTRGWCPSTKKATDKLRDYCERRTGKCLNDGGKLDVIAWHGLAKFAAVCSPRKYASVSVFVNDSFLVHEKVSVESDLWEEMTNVLDRFGSTENLESLDVGGTFVVSRGHKTNLLAPLPNLQPDEEVNITAVFKNTVSVVEALVLRQRGLLDEFMGYLNLSSEQIVLNKSSAPLCDLGI